MNEDSDAGGCVMTHHIYRVAVLGAGTMGAAVAAHAANAGLSVDLLDIVPPGAKGKERNSIVKAGFERMLKAKPTALMHESLAEHIRLGNFEDDFERLKEADWILEAIIERLEPKQELMARIEQVAKAGAIISSNTSGIPLANVAEDALRRSNGVSWGHTFLTRRAISSCWRSSRPQTPTPRYWKPCALLGSGCWAK